MLHPMMPNQFRSYEQYRRLHHQDLDDLSDRDLFREIKRIEYAVAFDDDAPAWLDERLKVLIDENVRRQVRARRDAKRR